MNAEKEINNKTGQESTSIELRSGSSVGVANTSELSSVEVFEKHRQAWEQVVGEAKKRVTPQTQIDKKGEFPYAEFSYMDAEMDHFHPRRAVKVINEGYDPLTYTFSFTVEITDLLTGECRPGTGLHPMIIYKSGTDEIKSQKDIRQLMANAKKAALTEAIRDAMAHFGVAADLYGMLMRKPPSTQQFDRFYAMIKVLSTQQQENVILQFNTQTEETADIYIDKLQAAIDKIKQPKGTQ